MADTATEEREAVLATVQALMDTIPPRDGAAMRELLVPGGSAVRSRDDTVLCTPLADFPNQLPGGTEAMEERFYQPVVLIDADIAMVWTRYDFLVDGQVHHWGHEHSQPVEAGGPLANLRHSRQRPHRPPPGRLGTRRGRTGPAQRLGPDQKGQRSPTILVRNFPSTPATRPAGTRANKTSGNRSSG